MRIGVAPHRLWPDRNDDLLDVVRIGQLAERLGFDHVIAGSHVLTTQLGVTLDPLTLLSTVAGATSRIRVVTSVLILPLHHPVVLAHQAASLDVVSGGRLVLGVGTGWDADEFDALGVPFHERGKLTDEHLTTMKALWRPEQHDGVRIGVAPSTSGGPPVWVGGHSDAALRRALRFADAWHGAGADPATVADVRRRLAEFAGQVGRDPATLALTSGQFLVPPGFQQEGQVPGVPLGGAQPSVERIREELGLLGEAGLSGCSLWLAVPTAALPDALAWVAEEILPTLDAGPETGTASLG